MKLTRLQEAALNHWGKLSIYQKIVLAFALLMVGYLVWAHNLILPDQFFLLALLVSLLLNRARTFLWDWAPLIALLWGYDYVRGLVPRINDHVHFQPMIGFDRLFGDTIPTIALQERFYVADSAQWYDYTAATLYVLHFIVPLAVAFVFWLQDRSLYRRYAAAFLILSYAAYLTYLAFPAAPPWLAAEAGLVPAIHRVLGQTFAQLSDPISLPTLYAKVGVNRVAAVPSLHAAYPLLTTLFVVRKVPKLLPLFAVYVLGVWTAVIYMGEHYLFDVVAGATYAIAAFLVVIYWPAIRKLFSRGAATA
jgi:hypothetical protein